MKSLLTMMLDNRYVENHDAMEFFTTFVFQSKQSDASYDELIYGAENQHDTREKYIGFVRDRLKQDDSVCCYTAIDGKTLRSVYRFIAKDFEDYDCLYLWRKRCYPDLLFTTDAFAEAGKIGGYKDNYDEIRKCLSILNDEGRQFYQSKTEDEAIRELQTKSGVSCSGKGSSEKSTFKKLIRYSNSQGKVAEYYISCIPHFKLDAPYSDKRLYFSWGREEIGNHRIIVAYVGRHWHYVPSAGEVAYLLD